MKYVYDSNVAYCKQIKLGDLLVTRDENDVLGFGYVEHITSAPSSKTMKLCPNCGQAGPDARVTMEPRYKCARCKETFDEPALRDRRVEVYEAYYGDTWCPLSRSLPRSVLEPIYRNRSVQNAIRPLDMAALLDLLIGVAPLSALGQLAEGRPNHSVTLPGGHRVVSARARIGQSGFRRAMLERYGEVCAISGPQPPEALHAAHLYVYAEAGTHDADGGLLLRADLHTLFDSFRLSIDPSTWTVRVDPSLSTFPHLAAYEGAAVRIGANEKPNPDYLQAHLDSAMARWVSA